MADIFPAIVEIFGASTKIKQYLIIPIKNQYSYLFRYKRIVGGLRDQNKKLKSSRDHLQVQIQAAENNLQVILPHVKIWCANVDELKGKIDRILREEPQVENAACMHGTCPNLKLRCSLSREATKLTADAVKLQEEFGKFGSHISDPAPPQTIPATSETREFDSRMNKEEDIMSYLKDSSIRLIGVWGMGGVGKTTMAKKIRKKAIEEKLFDDIVMAVVGQQVDIQKIQQQLAEGLGLHLRVETVILRAEKLHVRLKDKKVLIILDDVWERLNLEEVGITSQIKILLTTRDHQVCRMMSTEGATKILALEVLSVEEAFSLFRENAGSSVDHPNLQLLARDVAKECKGLPLALVTVGRSLNGKTHESSWKEYLRQLQMSAPIHIRGYLKDVFRPLKLSYEHLESDEARYLFLLCCLFPEDSEIEIENLVRYGVGLRIFSAVESINDARNRVHSVVETLIDRCLLMDAGEKPWPTYVKMHDVIRDMALSIASGGKHVFMVNHDKGLREWPESDSNEDYTCISLGMGEAMAFPECIRYPRLNALLLTFEVFQFAPWLASKLPVNFFNELADLRLLSFERQHRFGTLLQLSLPFLSPLKNLRVLHLYGCEPENICLIGPLVSLEILSCRASGVRELPDEIGALAKLKLLDLTNSSLLRKIAPGVISKLVHLEELRLMNCPIKWEGKEEETVRNNASLVEVFSLRNLRCLEIWIPDSELIYQEFCHLQNLTSYYLLISPKEATFKLEGSYTDLKRMEVCVNEKKVCLLFRDVEELILQGNGSKDVMDLLVRQGFERIKHLTIDGLDSVKHLASNSDIFPVLRHLELWKMNHLEEICQGPPSVGSFSQLEYLYLYDLESLQYLWKSLSETVRLSCLTEIKIESCKNLKWVFLLSIAESLSQLQSIEVQDCPMIEEVFKDERGSETGFTSINHHFKFPKLKEMILDGLPRLCDLCRTVDVFEFPSMETLQVEITEVPTKNFLVNQLGEVTCTKLSYLCMSGIGMEIFYRDVQISSFTQLQDLEISSFDSLKTLFCLDVFRGLINLRELTVRSCLMLEEIVKIEEGEDEGHRNGKDKIIIPKFERLTFLELPKIRCFCSFSNALKLPSLEVVNVSACPMMETFAMNLCCSSSMSNSSSIPRFFLSEQVTCTNLSNLCLSGLGMRTLFCLDVFRGLINLWKLTVESCLMLEFIVKMEEGEDVGHRNGTDKIIIPELKWLELLGLPKIRCFCSFSNALELPSLEEVRIRDCPMMETFAINLCCSSSMSNNSSIPRFFLSEQVACTKLSNLHMSGLGMRTLFCLDVFRGLINLKELTVRSCMMLEDIVKMKENDDERHRNETDKIIISKLKLLELSGLPKIRCFCLFSNALELPSLEYVRIKDCPMMETFAMNLCCVGGTSNNSSIPRFFFSEQVTCTNLSNLRMSGLGMSTLFCSDVFRGLINLWKITVESCLMLEYIVKTEDGEDLGHRNGTDKIIIPELKLLELLGLPKLHCFCSFSNALELPSLEEVRIRDCPMMETFAMNLRCSNSTSNNSSIPRFFLSEQVSCPELKELRLSNLKGSNELFSHEIPVASLRHLGVICCENLKSLFTLRTFGGLTNLQSLWVENCLMIERVIAKEVADEQGSPEMEDVAVRLPQLHNLILEDLQNLRGFSDMHSDLELPSLKQIRVMNCTKMKTSFCVGGGSVRMPKGAEVFGLRDPEFASKLFFKGEYRQDDDGLNNDYFMLLPSDLSFAWDSFRLPSMVKGSSDVFFPTRWRKVCGKFDMTNLSSRIVYEIVFVIMLLRKPDQFSGDTPKVEIILAEDKRMQNMMDIPTDQWVEILFEELRPSSDQCGEITFSLETNEAAIRSEVLFKGVSIRVKETVA